MHAPLPPDGNKTQYIRVHEIYEVYKTSLYYLFICKVQLHVLFIPLLVYTYARSLSNKPQWTVHFPSPLPYR